LREIVNAQCSLDRCDAVHHLLEPVFVKQLMFLLLELFAERTKLLPRYDLSQRREQNGVLARFMLPLTRTWRELEPS